MYIICTYDVEEKRCVKVMKVLRQYLYHVQKSVFEGTLTPKKFEELKNKLSDIITDNDSAHFYISYNEKQIYKEEIGISKPPNNIII